MELTGKRILVTGGAVRVGRAICLELAAAGAQLVCHYHSSEREAARLAANLQAKGRIIDLLREDLSAPGGAERLGAAAEKSGPVTALVNSAAVFFPKRIDEISEADWDAHFSLNLKSAFFLSRYLGARMKERGNGRIVNIGDVAGEKPWARYLPYSLSKAGVIAMTRGLARALAPEVLVNCVNPGPVLLPDDYTESQRQAAIRNTLLKREGSPDEVARSVRMLLESDYITGAVLPVDGGRSLS